ncbi:ADP-ribosylglycohydrolase family protein [Acinetobacter sp. ANC 5414]|uniref:ADP-ribosylglycohydrolase family protein n=1 Tax=Acinetobacter sp. ANC 5414 TaxID=2731251 RepID=UPI00148FD062|nr:ADP-ribosylglycohydrolase family protein [Acinetobacter sp. ANC 5414]NNH00822.1 ADP-ribosylglycohydrolase family protein [Acinetobacter sp. ANC 5414]
MHQEFSKAFENRAFGCLIGLACGDAVGTTVEFLPRERFKPLTDMVGGGKFKLDPGMWTDDTSMALCLAESLILKKGFDANDQMQHYSLWLYEGHNSCLPHAFGVGKTILNALFRYHKTGRPYSGRIESRFSGNGSLMRLAPIAIYYHDDKLQLDEYSALSSKTTHASLECIQACQFFAKILVNALYGKTKEELFLVEYSSELEALSSIINGNYKLKNADNIKSGGFVLDSLEAALWAFWHTDNFKDAILAAANLGDDADTTAAICGQLAGAYYGLEQIPSEWKNKLFRYKDILKISRCLLYTSLIKNNNNCLT